MMREGLGADWRDLGLRINWVGTIHDAGPTDKTH